MVGGSPSRYHSEHIPTRMLAPRDARRKGRCSPFQGRLANPVRHDRPRYRALVPFSKKDVTSPIRRPAPTVTSWQG